MKSTSRCGEMTASGKACKRVGRCPYHNSESLIDAVMQGLLLARRINHVGIVDVENPSDGKPVVRNIRPSGNPSDGEAVVREISTLERRGYGDRLTFSLSPLLAKALSGEKTPVGTPNDGIMGPIYTRSRRAVQLERMATDPGIGITEEARKLAGELSEIAAWNQTVVDERRSKRNRRWMRRAEKRRTEGLARLENPFDRNWERAAEIREKAEVLVRPDRLAEFHRDLPVMLVDLQRLSHVSYWTNQLMEWCDKRPKLFSRMLGIIQRTAGVRSLTRRAA
jgi:hypothetical protein